MQNYDLVSIFTRPVLLSSCEMEVINCPIWGHMKAFLIKEEITPISNENDSMMIVLLSTICILLNFGGKLPSYSTSYIVMD